MCLGIYVYCVLVVLCLSLGCVFCFLWCVACCWMCFVSMSCVLVSYVAGLVWGCVSACGVLVVGLFGVRASLGCSVYVSGLLIVWCVPYVCAPLLGVLCALCVAWCLYWFVVLGVLVVGLCLCGCGGFRGLGVCCFLFLGFGLVLFFGWLLGFCFLLGGGVLVWLVVCFCWLFGWFLCVGGGWLRLIFLELYYLC